MSGFVMLPLGGAAGGHALVDIEDVEAVTGVNWYGWRASRRETFYARTNTSKADGQRAVYMHQVLVPGHARVDHVNGNGLDNRRCNLRGATHRQNMANQRPQRRGSSLYKGVSLNGRSKAKPWRAQIRVDGRCLHLGYHETELEAARAYDEAAVEHFGEFAHPNLKNDTPIVPFPAKGPSR